MDTTAGDRLRKDAIGELMCNGVLDLGALAARHGIDTDALFSAEMADVAALERDGLVHVQPGRIEVTPLGRLLVRRVAMVFDGHLRADAHGAALAQQLAEASPPVSILAPALAREVPMTQHRSRYSRVV
jgi:oxygen-independent coproporphyrinogen-3 oxidase